MNERTTHLAELATLTKAILEGALVQQVGAFCFRAGPDRSAEILLVTTRGTRRWTIPKGWPIAGLKPHKAAEREAWEEGGVKGKAGKRAFGSYSYIKALPAGRVPAIVDVYVLAATTTRAEFPEQEERDVLWLPPLEAALLVREPELKSLMAKFAKTKPEWPC